MTPKNGNPAPKPTEYRCKYCGRLHFKAYLAPATHVELVCPRSHCGRLSVYEGVWSTGTIEKVMEKA